MADFLNNIADKKCRVIQEATTKQEISDILKPSVSQYNGNGFVPTSPYHAEEEEILLLSTASLQAPLNDYACKRMLKLMAGHMPESFYEALNA